MSKTYTNEKNIPQPIADAIRNNRTYDLDHRDTSKISVTTLIGSPLIRYLSNLHADEITVDVSDEFWSLYGSAIHSILENNGPGYINEIRLEYDTGVVAITGKSDCLDLCSKTLWDWKSTKVYSYIAEYGEPKLEHILQLNVLGWLWRQHGVEVKHLKLGYIFLDWKVMEYMQAKNSGKPYPAHNVIEKEISILSNEWNVEYIQKRLEEHGYINNDYFPAVASQYECTKAEKWQDDDIYQVKKIGQDKSIKNCNSLAEAREYINERFGDIQMDYEVFTKEGKPVRCMDSKYCKVNRWCDFGKQFIKE